MQQLKEPFEKTKKFLHRSLRDLKKVLLIGDYRRLTKSTSCNPFSFGRTKTKNGRGDCYYTDFCDDWQCDLDKSTKRKNMSCILGAPGDQCREELASNRSSMRLGTASPIRKKGGEVKEKAAKRSSSSSRKDEDQLGNAEGGYPLAKKMKELEMIDGSDVEHVLDVEEAVHYYSRLRSPVYLGLVDKFFTDMYTEFATPPASAASITSSKRRLSSLRL